MPYLQHSQSFISLVFLIWLLLYIILVAAATQITYTKGEKEEEQQQIHTTTTIWLSATPRRPTLYIPVKLAEKYGMNSRCRVTVSDSGKGIEIRFLHYKTKNKSSL